MCISAGSEASEGPEVTLHPPSEYIPQTYDHFMIFSGTIPNATGSRTPCPILNCDGYYFVREGSESLGSVEDIQLFKNRAECISRWVIVATGTPVLIFFGSRKDYFLEYWSVWSGQPQLLRYKNSMRTKSKVN